MRVSLDAAVEKAVAAALDKALGPYLRRLSNSRAACLQRS
jgi:hypothetical protein